MKTASFMHEGRRTTIAVDVEGRGPSVLLLHGIPGSRLTWRRTVEALGGKFTTIAPDLPGFGRSSSLPAGMHARWQAGAIAALLDEMDVTSTHIVGFDFGGPVSAYLHSMRPARVASLTFVSTNLLRDTPIPLPLRLSTIPGVGELLFAFLFSTIGMRGLWLAAVRRRRALPMAEFLSCVSPDGLRTTRRIFLESLRALRELYTPIEASLASIDVPATVVWGDRDPFFGVDVGLRTAAAVPGSRFVTFDGCGHFVPGECPRELAEVIAQTAGPGESPT